MASKEAPVLGIDLGTSTSLACVMHDDERLEVITPDPHYPSDLLPSVFCWTDEGARVGKAAEELLAFQKHCDSVVRCVKREMKNPSRTFMSGGVRYSPVQISGFLLKRLREAAEDQLGLSRGAITRAVITVPAHFGQIERKATRQAGEEEAGFDEVHLLDEPIAAAIGMRLKARLAGDKLVLVFDLGGGTLDVTLLKVGNRWNGGFFELGRDGHDELGGVNWDKVIAQDVVFQHDRTRGDGFRRDADFFNLNNIRLYEPCEEAKKDFSSNHEDLDQVLVSYWDKQLGKLEDSSITRQRYHEQTAYLAEACASICDRLLQSIHVEDLASVRKGMFSGLLGKGNVEPIGWADIDEIFMVGGGSKVRAVRDKLEQHWGRQPTLNAKPQHQVVFGAAIVAANLGKGGDAMQQMLLRSPHTYGYYAPRDGQKRFFPIIHKNARVPREEKVVCGVGGAGSVFQIEIVEERIDLQLLSGKMLTKYDVVEELQAKVPPRQVGSREETATLRLDYRNDREITFDVTFRGQTIIRRRIQNDDDE